MTTQRSRPTFCGPWFLFACGVLTFVSSCSTARTPRPIEPLAGWESIRVQGFVINGVVCIDEPIDLIVLFHNQSAQPIEIPGFSVVSEVTQKQGLTGEQLVGRNLWVTATAEEEQPVMLERVLDEERRLDRLSRPLQPGEIRPLVLQLLPVAVQEQRLRKLVKGEPERLQVVWSSRRAGSYRLEVGWAPDGLESETKVFSNPVHIEMTRDPQDGCRAE